MPQRPSSPPRTSNTATNIATNIATNTAVQRRSFLARVGAGLAAFSAAAAAPSVAPSVALAQPVTPGGANAQGSGFQPARHAQDDWFDQIPGVHRFFFDATSPTGVGDAITFASNYYVANKSGYGLEAKDLAVVICLRHWATPFAFSDEMWAKYGAALAERIKFADPRTKAVPTANVYQADDYGPLLTNRGTTLDAMIKRGTHFAVCDMATRAFAGIAATKTGGKAEDIYQELKGTAIRNAHFMAAGIVAVNRAQERGYSLQYIG
ncbi:MAG: hypothetical protein IT359_11410 [Gemmatimonadaceae bacterium]|nr:hypothetical protein [Gemmatimonadaceae bacterium]